MILLLISAFESVDDLLDVDAQTQVFTGRMLGDSDVGNKLISKRQSLVTRAQS